MYTGVTKLPGWRHHPQYYVHFATALGLTMGSGTSYPGELPTVAWRKRNGKLHAKDVTFLRRELSKIQEAYFPKAC